MAKRITDEKLELSVMGRTHSEAVSEILRTKHAITAIPFSTARGMFEILVREKSSPFSQYEKARIRYKEKA